MKLEQFHDPYFKVKTISSIPNPQQAVYLALHQDYSEYFVVNNLDYYEDSLPDEKTCGEIAIKRLLAGNRNHWGCLEHPQIILGVGYFPHSVMQQARTHRVGISFDVQSFRYSGKRIIDVVTGNRDIEEVFYIRPVGHYTDRQGKRYEYAKAMRDEDLEMCMAAAERYVSRIEIGVSEEHARSTIPFDVRQHFVVSFNARSLCHFIDLRGKADAQLEIQVLASMLLVEFEKWMPEIAAWYKENRYKKGLLAP